MYVCKYVCTYVWMYVWGRNKKVLKLLIPLHSWKCCIDSILLCSNILGNIFYSNIIYTVIPILFYWLQLYCFKNIFLYSILLYSNVLVLGIYFYIFKFVLCFKHFLLFNFFRFRRHQLVCLGMYLCM
jgi:hypothetical protein